MAAASQARYGVDAPGALSGLVAGAAASVLWTVAGFRWQWWGRWFLILASVYTVASAASFAYATLRGKFDVWAEELDDLQLSGSERVADLGCGRGAVLILVAKRLTTGRATGVDLWRSKDQSGNSETAAARNAEAEGLADRIELVTGDLRELPLLSQSADLVVSSLVIHNIGESVGREAAVAHAYRILTPGGRLRIADFQHTEKYAEVLRTLGAQDVAVRRLGWRFWYGGPWFATSMVSAGKPSD